MRDMSVWWRLPSVPGLSEWQLATDTLSAFEVEAVKEALATVFVALGHNDYMTYGAKSSNPPYGYQPKESAGGDDNG